MISQTQTRDTSFTVGWWLLLAATALMLLNHTLMAFVLDEPILFAGWALFNAVNLIILCTAFRRREVWAWAVTWLLPLGLTIPAVMDRSIATIYFTTAAVCVIGLLLTARASGAQNWRTSAQGSRAGSVGIALLVVGLATLGCQPLQPAASAPADAAAPAADSSGALPELTIAVTADGIQVPAEVPAGPTRINLVNETGAMSPEGGPLLPDVGRLADGATLEELMAVLPSAMQNPMPMLELFKSYGTAIAPTAQLIWDLQPGHHVATVLAEAPMVQPFIVTDADAGGEVVADVAVTLQDFAFVMADSIAAGPQLWEITNAGTQWHELVVITKPAEMTVEEVLAALPAEGPPVGPMPFEINWGYVVLAEGNRVWAEVDLAPGEYTVICFLPDLHGDMAPHAAHGMVRTLTVN